MSTDVAEWYMALCIRCCEHLGVDGVSVALQMVEGEPRLVIETDHAVFIGNPTAGPDQTPVYWWWCAEHGHGLHDDCWHEALAFGEFEPQGSRSGCDFDLYAARTRLTTKDGPT